jgi:hypothetical protein
MVKKIKIEPPTWETAMRIYIKVLEQKNSGEKAKQGARDDLMTLARDVDKINKENKSE